MSASLRLALNVYRWTFAEIIFFFFFKVCPACLVLQRLRRHLNKESLVMRLSSQEKKKEFEEVNELHFCNLL